MIKQRNKQGVYLESDASIQLSVKELHHKFINKLSKTAVHTSNSVTRNDVQGLANSMSTKFLGRPVAKSFVWFKQGPK
jgi:hypothetical protein